LDKKRRTVDVRAPLDTLLADGYSTSIHLCKRMLEKGTNCDYYFHHRGLPLDKDLHRRP
jgi:hypothetical protein